MRATLTALVLLAGCAASSPAGAPVHPAAELRQGDVAVALYREPCALAAVANLPYRVTWRDARGVFEGCFAVQHGSVVAMYFDDRTVVTLPVRVFGSGAQERPEGI